MSSTIITIAEAVKDQLNAGSFGQNFTAVRAYRPVYELSEMDTLHVTVVARDVTVVNAGRGLTQMDVRIDVAIQQRCDTDDAGLLDPLMSLVEEVSDAFLRTPLTTYGQATCTKVENAPIYAVEHIDQLRQFTSIITLTFRVLR